MNPIDELFKEQLGNQAHTPPAHGFDAIQKNLKQSKRAFYWKRATLILAATAAVLSGLAIFIPNLNQEKQEMVYNPRIFTPNAVAEETEITPEFEWIENNELEVSPKNLAIDKSAKKNKIGVSKTDLNTEKVNVNEAVANIQKPTITQPNVKLKFTIIIEESTPAIASAPNDTTRNNKETDLIKTFEEVYQYAGTQWGNFKNGEQLEAPKPIAELADQARNINLASVRNGVNQFLNKN